jgi:UDP-N-acetylglucosamine:LPS N-acetylglucosamine transferase
VLAISSGGGHWLQLLRLGPAFEGLDVAFATLDANCRVDVGAARFYVVRDGSRWNKLKLIVSAFSVLLVLLRERPFFVISTGAAPGLFGIIFGKLLRSRTIWVDSIANAEQLSMSGRIAGRWADLWLTQWPELARPGGPEYAGTVL